MAEILTLTAPEPSIVTWEPFEITLNTKRGSINAVFESNAGTIWTYYEQDDTTRAAIVALNTANLSTKSLKRRLLERIIAKGVKVGTISGSPDA